MSKKQAENQRKPTDLPVFKCGNCRLKLDPTHESVMVAIIRYRHAPWLDGVIYVCTRCTGGAERFVSQLNDDTIPLRLRTECGATTDKFGHPPNFLAKRYKKIMGHASPKPIRRLDERVAAFSKDLHTIQCADHLLAII